MIRFVGDVHGGKNINKYLDIIEDVPNSVQIGDLGLSYNFFFSEQIDVDKDKFFPGNHDNYDLCFKSPHCLGDYGFETLGDVPFYYVRGAFSVDHWWRTKYVNLWPNEELNKAEFSAAIDDYANTKPDLMVTHDCPNVVRDKILKDGGDIGYGKIETRTGSGLQNMLDAHFPKTWIFGHWHMSLDFKIGETRFICLPKLGYIDIE